jgi:cysteine-rich repeat protein
MRRKVIGKLFLTTILFIFLLSAISAAVTLAQNTCDIVASGECTGTGYNILMGISSTTNAHGQSWGQSPAYADVLCCNFGTASPNCDGTHSIIKLSSATNAHAESALQTNYGTSVCFGDLQCIDTITSCSTDYPIAMLSLSSATNAHIGKFVDYPVKICCKGSLTSLCSFTDAYWGIDNTITTPEATKGAIASLSVIGTSSCASKEASITVYKKGLLGGTAIDSAYQPLGISFDSEGKAVGSWDTINSELNGVYYFVANIINVGVATRQSNDLTIKNSDNYASVSTCEDYQNQADCQNDGTLAKVAGKEIEDVQGAGFCDEISHHCYCSWDNNQPSGKKCAPTWNQMRETGCGNGIQETGEQCDDGNTVNGDGCSSICTFEGTTGPCQTG